MKTPILTHYVQRVLSLQSLCSLPCLGWTCRGHHEELRCVLAVIRHGDRTPKQKMKMKVTQVIDLHRRV